MKNGIYPSVIFYNGKCEKVWKVKGFNLLFSDQKEAELFRAELTGK